MPLVFNLPVVAKCSQGGRAEQGGQATFESVPLAGWAGASRWDPLLASGRFRVSPDRAPVRGPGLDIASTIADSSAPGA